MASRDGEITFRDAERAIRESVLAIGRAMVVLFLSLREDHVVARLPEGTFERAGRAFRRAPRIARNLTTLFGTVRYWRTYVRGKGSGARGGYHPLDLALGLGADRLSWNVLSRAVRLATELSFARAKTVLSEFVPNAPSTEVIEQALLGFGAHAEAFFEMQPAPSDDGEVLIVEIDGKGAPTAKASELAKRRGKRRRRTLTPRSRRDIEAAPNAHATPRGRDARRATSPRTPRSRRWS
ncbi:MAG: hypothetical protein KF901_05855 [Myxococcales bacterium]|nr:hypothetical protein [Myxococcales bacterium]